MPGPFQFDVFLSYSSKDRAEVEALAERLRADGLSVWFDRWVLRPGDSIPAKIEDGLERSRVLVLCMSANAFGSEWARLESGTFRFRDPLNQELRFVPLRFDDAPIPGSLAQFLYVDWRPKERDREYPRLRDACRPPEALPAEEQEARDRVVEKILSLGHTNSVRRVAWSPDGRRALSGAADSTLRLWDVETGRCLRVLEGHTDSVWSVAWSPDGRRALSGSADESVRLWEVETGRCLCVLEGHTASVWTVAWSPNGRQALTGSTDKSVRLWEVETGRYLRCSKATPPASGAWHGARTAGGRSPGPLTTACGCGRWRRAAACACSKATQTASSVWFGV